MICSSSTPDLPLIHQRQNVWSRYLLIIAGCAILLGIALRLTQLDTRTLYIDESYTELRVAGHTAAEMASRFYDGRQINAGDLLPYAVVDSTSSIPRLIASLEREDAQHPPLFYILEWTVVQIFGSSLASWRLLPVVFGILSIAAAYFFARKLFCNDTIGLVAAAAFAVSPIERIYSEQAREYSLLTLLVLLSSSALIQASRDRSTRSWATYALLIAASLYTSPLVLSILAAHGLFVVLGRRHSHKLHNITAFAIAMSVALFAYLPWIYELTIHRSDISETNKWSGTAWPIARLAAKWTFNAGSAFFDLDYLNLRWAICFALVALVAIISIFIGFRESRPEARFFLASIICVPAIILITPDILLGQHRSAVARYALPIIAMLTIALAPGISRKPLLATIMIGAGLISSMIGSFHASWWDNDSNADDASIAALINRVPGAQVASTITPSQFIVFARLLDPSVKISLASNLNAAEFSSKRPVFILRPSLIDLQAVEERRSVHFSAVAFPHALTAHDLGASISTNLSNRKPDDEPAEVYRSTTVHLPARIAN